MRTCYMTTPSRCENRSYSRIISAQQTEQKVIKMFKEIEQVFDKLYSNNNKFLNYSYVLNKLFHMIHMPHIANCFPLLKSKYKLIRHDEMLSRNLQTT